MILREQAQPFSVSEAIRFLWSVFYLTQIKPSATYRLVKQLAKLRRATNWHDAFEIIRSAVRPATSALRARYQAFFFNAAVRTN